MRTSLGQKSKFQRNSSGEEERTWRELTSLRGGGGGRDFRKKERITSLGCSGTPLGQNLREPLFSTFGDAGERERKGSKTTVEIWAKKEEGKKNRIWTSCNQWEGGIKEKNVREGDVQKNQKNGSVKGETAREEQSHKRKKIPERTARTRILENCGEKIRRNILGSWSEDGAAQENNRERRQRDQTSGESIKNHK